jgi:hypothetical protein
MHRPRQSIWPPDFFRPEGLGLLMMWADPDEKPGFHTEFGRAFVEKIPLRQAPRFWPC